MMTDDTMTTAEALRVLACCGRAYLELNEDPSEATTEQVDEAMAHLFSLGILDGIRIHSTRRHVRAISDDGPHPMKLSDGQITFWAERHQPGRVRMFWDPDTDTEETP